MAKPAMVKGLFFKELIKLLKKKKDKNTLNLLEKEFKTLDFSAFKNYPAEYDVRFQKTLCLGLFGKEDTKIHFLVSKDYYWQVVANSIVTKTIFTLSQNDPRKIIPQIVKLNNAFTDGLEITYEFSNKDAKHNHKGKAKVCIKNYPYNPEHYQGIFYGGIESLGYKPTVTYDKLDQNSYEFTLIWEK